MAETLGDYKLLRRIATGGMGEIYLAELRRSGGFRKAVALKTILPAYACKKDFAALFESEAAIAASLNHVNIVHVFDYGCADGRTYMTQEFVEGPDIDGLLTACRDESLPLELVAEIGLQACRGLAHAHERRDLRGRPVGVVHGDVSPANLLLSMEGQVKLADFGLARLRDAAMGDGSISGKFCYMSPEQARGEPLGPASDLFSLGAVLFELLSGQRAFPLRDPPTDTLEEVRAARHLRLDRLRSDLPPGFVELVEACLEADPAQRPRSAQSLAESIVHTQIPCGPEGLASFLKSRAARLGRDLQLAPEPTEVAQRPLAETAPPSTRRWIGALLFLFLIAWGAGLAWIIVNPKPPDYPAPPALEKPRPPPLPDPAPASSEVFEPSEEQAPKTRALRSRPDARRPSLPDPEIAEPTPGQARLSLPDNMRAWVDHRAVSGRQLGLDPQATHLLRLQAEDGSGPEVTLRLQPPESRHPAWRMSLRAKPWMHIRLDGRPAGQTPRSDMKLGAGRRRLELERDGDKLLLGIELPVQPKG